MQVSKKKTFLFRIIDRDNALSYARWSPIRSDGEGEKWEYQVWLGAVLSRRYGVGVDYQGAGSGKDARTKGKSNGKIHGRVRSEIAWLAGWLAVWMDDADTKYKKHNLENGGQM